MIDFFVSGWWLHGHLHGHYCVVHCSCWNLNPRKLLLHASGGETSPSTGRSIWSAATHVGTVEVENRTLHELPSCVFLRKLFRRWCVAIVWYGVRCTAYVMDHVQRGIGGRIAGMLLYSHLIYGHVIFVNSATRAVSSSF